MTYLKLDYAVRTVYLNARLEQTFDMYLQHFLLGHPLGGERITVHTTVDHETEI